jgi:phosphoglycolate phosphatase
LKQSFDLVVFDWDGTLVDSTDPIAESLKQACADLGLATPSDHDARYVIGLGFEEAVRHLAPQLHADRYPQLVERYRAHYSSASSRVKPFPGVIEGLRALRAAGFLIAVATGKSRRGLDRSLDDSGVRRYTNATRCADEGLPKPHPDMLNWLMTKLEVDKNRTLMIGDTTHDLQMARNAGVASIAATYGAHSQSMLEEYKPLACLSSFREFLQWAQLDD